MQSERSASRRAARSAIDDLAKRLAIDEADITVVRAEEVDWPNGKSSRCCAGAH